MGRLISIYGQGGSGKTTLSYALADRLAAGKNLVLIVHTDFCRPVLSERVPQLSNALSLGHLLMTDDYVNIERTYVSYPENKNVFVSGIINNENFTSYPQVSPTAANRYFDEICEIFDYVLIDSTANVTDTLALSGLGKADVVIELLSANIQGIVFQRAYDRMLEGMHAKSKTTYAAAKLQQYHDVSLVEHEAGIRFGIRLPYSNEVDYKAMSGGVIKGCARREGIQYENEIGQLQRMVS